MGYAAKRQIELLHQGSQGYISVCQKHNGEWKQRGYHYNDALEELRKLIGQENVYISQNDFYQPGRNNRNVLHYRSCYCDLDYYKMPGLFAQTPEQILAWLETEYFNQSVPTPNYILFSGRGLSIVWLIEPEPKDMLPMWTLAQQYILRALSEMGADPQAMDPARVMRVADTINSKNKAVTHLKIYFSTKYELKEIIEYIPDSILPKPKADKPQRKPITSDRKKTIVSIMNERTLLYARMNDLVTLQSLRKDCTGSREFMAFLHRYWSTCFYSDPEQALKETIDFNNDFAEPLSLDEVIKATKSAEKAYSEKIANQPKGTFLWGGYKYRNDTLISKLGITPEEQKRLKTIISKEEKTRRHNNLKKNSRRNENGLTKRQQKKEDKQKLAIELHSKGFTITEVADQVGVSVRSISTYLRNSRK